MLGGRSLGGEALCTPLPRPSQACFVLFGRACSQGWEGFLDRGPAAAAEAALSPAATALLSAPGAAQAAAWSSGGPTCSSASSPSCPRPPLSHRPPRSRSLQVSRKVRRGMGPSVFQGAGLQAHFPSGRVRRTSEVPLGPGRVPL